MEVKYGRSYFDLRYIYGPRVVVRVMLYTRGSQPFLACGPLYYFLWTSQFTNILLKLLNVDPQEIPWTPVGNPCSRQTLLARNLSTVPNRRCNTL